MPEQETIERAHEDAREGKSPSTQAGEFVREEIHHVREGKHGAQSTKQAIAIGLSKARRAGVRIPRKGAAKKAAAKKSRAGTKRSRAAKKANAKRTSGSRARGARKALARAPRRGVASTDALSRQARSAAKRRGPAKRSAAAKKAARTRKKTGR